MTFSMELTDEQRELQGWAHAFAEEVIRPAAREWDEREETPWPIIQEAARIGLYGYEIMATLRQDDTGQSYPILCEELFWGDAGIGLSIMGTGLAAAGIASAGTTDQIIEWVPRCYGTEAEPAVGGFCSSEPEAGSDVGNMRTRARYDEATDEWVISGQKAWVTNGGVASVLVVQAVVDPELGSRGQAAFVMEAGTPGIEAGPRLKKHGLRASATADIFFDDVRVPGSALLGGKEKLDEKLARAREGERTGGQAAMATFERTRPTVGAMAVGIARAAHEYALEYAKGRVVFGRPIIENQAISFLLADMAVEIDASRLLVRRAAWLGATRQPMARAEGSMSKLKAGRTAVWATERAIQILGGVGYTREYPVERMHRDAKIFDIFEGTEQIQQLVIARAISGQRLP
ncbi:MULTISPECIES: acyl-CoA dehydrogenase family protein [unclassified Dietzia]|uniref:acyl-CoA dehydrogenase family protein n=1 Tax=unclassified Dietzia TaxID=2617939 RepID=UPI0015F99EAD|nr:MULTISPECIES: acyl-CoA dehydrogenase family protein [unclassified Dietzia]MBB1040696.1 acyl-CoA dehydrogenase [Dietzia sp. Cai40]MBB1043417.1 acyl-CoA dehydrogenase [Dietzia sp. DQ11-44]